MNFYFFIRSLDPATAWNTLAIHLTEITKAGITKRRTGQNAFHCKCDFTFVHSPGVLTFFHASTRGFGIIGVMTFGCTAMS